jgi:Z1 domain
MTELNQTGSFYPEFTRNTGRYSDYDKQCIRLTVERLLSTETSAARPGMLLGKIQSGKTKTFLGAIALGFDNGFDIAIILTKGTKALARQTIERVRREFATFNDRDQLQIYDIMTLPSGLTGYELSQKLIFVVKKQSDNMDRLTKVFRETYPQLAGKRVLIIDDEADYASIGFRNSKEEGLIINRTARQIDALRQVLPESAFLQVTATPYSLYLQPEDLVIQGIEFKPIRPAFTELVPVHADYIGSDYYFDRSQEHETVASFLYQPLTLDDFQILHHDDRRRFKIEDCLTSSAIKSLRTAICNFIVGGCIRRLQDEYVGDVPKKFSFLFHTEAGKAAHAWQEQIVIALNEKLTEAVRADPDVVRDLMTQAYDDLSLSIRVMHHYLPPREQVIDAVFDALEKGWVMITKVNSERQVEELLDNEGQLKLRTPLNIFIGGQILDRGVTIANLIGFFYGRRPKTYQQDTVLQHSRMFGFRPIEDLTVTRFYTEPGIYDAMRRMHESDVALRETFVDDPDRTVVFIQRDAAGSVIPCSPNKILVSNTTTLRPFKRILPVGFQTDYKTRIGRIVEEIDQTLATLAPEAESEEPFLIPLDVAMNLLRLIEETILMEKQEGYDFDWEAARAALEFLVSSTVNANKKGLVWCLIRTGRKMSRKVSIGTHGYYSDAPDTTRSEGTVAQQVAIDNPMLMLIRQNGREEQGWRGTPFYWPVIVAQRNIRTSIFAHETTV